MAHCAATEAMTRCAETYIAGNAAAIARHAPAAAEVALRLHFTPEPAPILEVVRLFSSGEKRSLGATLSRKLSVLENTPLSSFTPQGLGSTWMQYSHTARFPTALAEPHPALQTSPVTALRRSTSVQLLSCLIRRYMRKQARVNAA